MRLKIAICKDTVPWPLFTMCVQNELWHTQSQNSYPELEIRNGVKLWNDWTLPRCDIAQYWLYGAGGEEEYPVLTMHLCIVLLMDIDDQLPHFPIYLIKILTRINFMSNHYQLWLHNKGTFRRHKWEFTGRFRRGSLVHSQFTH